MIIGFDSFKVLIILDLVFFVVVFVSVRIGIDGNKFVRRLIFVNVGLNVDFGIKKKNSG